MIGTNKLAEWSLLFQMFLICQVKVSFFRGLVLVGDASTGGGRTSDNLKKDNQRLKSITAVYTFMTKKLMRKVFKDLRCIVRVPVCNSDINDTLEAIQDLGFSLGERDSNHVATERFGIS